MLFCDTELTIVATLQANLHYTVFVIDRSTGQKGCGGGACCQALYTDQPGSWKWHGHSLPQYQWSPALL